MSLSYCYEFTAAADTPPAKLEEFLREFEDAAESLGFEPNRARNLVIIIITVRAIGTALGPRPRVTLSFSLSDAVTVCALTRR